MKVELFFFHLNIKISFGSTPAMAGKFGKPCNPSNSGNLGNYFNPSNPGKPQRLDLN